MLQLPSGLVVDISTNRTKYHALKKQHKGPDVTHQELYPLVDIIIRYKSPLNVIKRGWTEYDYYYSSHTLADICHLTDWPEDDKQALRSWIKLPEQRQRIELTRRRLVPEQHLLSTKLNSSPQYLFSLLKKRLENISLNSANSKQWLATIYNMQQTGMRNEEIKWSGLEYFLSLHTDETILSKQQIINAINFNKIRLELSSERIVSKNGGLNFHEVARQMPHQAVYRASLKLDENCICILRYTDDSFNYRVGLVKTRNNNHHMALNKYWFALDPYGRAITNPNTSDLFFGSSETAMTACDTHSHHYSGLRTGTRFNTHYDHITLYGGNKYREWIVSLPDYQRTFFGAHYLDHNVLAHIRTTTRVDNKNRKLLFIEEIQSDWHQTGRKQGYDNSAWGVIPNAPFKKEWLALSIKLMLIRASQNGFDGIAWPCGSIQEMRYSKNLQAIKRYYDNEIPSSLNRLGRYFNIRIENTFIVTRDPWLNLVRRKNKWHVTDGQGKFKTRDKYHNREEAMAVINRHCRSINLEVPVFYINDELRRQISDEGLPLFGETLI
ncbi:MAG: hypothetical protein OQK47_04435 [Gammaproteobacteria bacterium]|nr:hypothetical protein [Gammaproteobacteria bacterium]